MDNQQDAREGVTLDVMVEVVIQRIILDVIKPGVPEVRECSDVAEELRRYAPKLADLLARLGRPVDRQGDRATRPSLPPMEVMVDRMVDAVTEEDDLDFGPADAERVLPYVLTGLRHCPTRDKALAALFAQPVAPRPAPEGWVNGRAEIEELRGIFETACSKLVEADEEIVSLREGLEEARQAHINAWRLLKKERAMLFYLVDSLIELIITDVIRPGTPETRECSDVAEELRKYAPQLRAALNKALKDYSDV